MSEELRIVAFRPADQAAARALILEGLGRRWGFIDATANPDLEDIASHHASGYFACAWQDGELIGTGGFLPLEGEPATVQIHRVSVRPARRRAGVGRAVVRHLLSIARERGAQRIILETTAEWTDAIAFWQRCGFVRFDERDGDVYFEYRERATPARIFATTEATQEREAVLALAEELGQAKYLQRAYPAAEETVLLGAFAPGDTRCAVGFLLLLVQVLGREEGRPPIVAQGAPLSEGYVQAFGVRAEERRQGIGRDLQEAAIAWCRQKGCYQMRSRSPVSATENYALKLEMGYTAHPSDENDSYFFLKKL